MKRTFIYCTIALALAFALAGCGQSGTYEPKKITKIEPVKLASGEEAKLFPLKVGNQWVYSGDTNGIKDELTIKVSKIVDGADGQIATLSTTNEKGETRDLDVQVNSRGIFQLTAMTGKAYTPPQPMVIFPLDSEKTEVNFSGPYPAMGEGPMKQVVKYLGPQEVDTDMGRMSAFAVESFTTWTTDKGAASAHAMAWWVPGIGFVRQRQELVLPGASAVIVMRLKSYTF